MLDAAALMLQVRASFNPQRPIVNNNFNLIKAFIHHWRAAVPLPLPALLTLLGAVPAKPSSGAADARAKRKAAEQRCVAMKLLAAGESDWPQSETYADMTQCITCHSLTTTTLLQLNRCITGTEGIAELSRQHTT